MTDHAYVSPDYPGRGVGIHLVRHLGETRTDIALPTTMTFLTVESDAGAYTEPTLRMPESMARALLDALSAHFGGSSDVQTLRKDYEAERARVDKFIDRLIVRPEQQIARLAR